MNLDDKYAELYHADCKRELTPAEYYEKQLMDGLYELGVVSNVPFPKALPNWDDYADMLNILDALNRVKESVKETIREAYPESYIPQS